MRRSTARAKMLTVEFILVTATNEQQSKSSQRDQDESVCQARAYWPRRGKNRAESSRYKVRWSQRVTHMWRHDRTSTQHRVEEVDGHVMSR